LAIIHPLGLLQGPVRVDGPPVATSSRNVAAAGAPTEDKKAADAFRQLEAFVLQTFVEAMLPKNAESVFGKGTAGGIWKSMLAERLADEIARNGGLGIARDLAASAAARANAVPAGASVSAPTASSSPGSKSTGDSSDRS
jgi:Rod binding domain-containing protein